MKLRRGFKSEANAYARELREEMSLRRDAPLSPWQLASYLEIPVHTLGELGTEIPAVRFLLCAGARVFSGVTIVHGTRRIILHNESSPRTRQASDVAHELAHAILGHPPSPPFNDAGKRNLDREIEREAEWLGAALLISEEAALLIARSGRSLATAAAEYGVSESLLQMRLNVTGARRRIRN